MAGMLGRVVVEARWEARATWPRRSRWLAPSLPPFSRRSHGLCACIGARCTPRSYLSMPGRRRSRRRCPRLALLLISLCLVARLCSRALNRARFALVHLYEAALYSALRYSRGAPSLQKLARSPLALRSRARLSNSPKLARLALDRIHAHVRHLPIRVIKVLRVPDGVGARRAEREALLGPDLRARGDGVSGLSSVEEGAEGKEETHCAGPVAAARERKREER